MTGETGASPGLRAGVAHIDITPDVAEREIPLHGYYDRGKKPAQGVHDPLFAKAVVLANGGGRITIVSADLLWIPGAMKTRVLELITSPDIGPESLLLCGTHSHSAPATLDAFPVYQIVFGAYNETLFEEIAQKLAAVIDEANAELQPAAAGVATRDLPELTCNRRDEPVTDPALTVLKVTGAGGDPLAVVANFSAHPTVLGPENLLISGDYPGAMQRQLQESIGNGAMVLFTNGAQGDQMHTAPENGDGFERAEQYGGQLAEAAYGLLEDVTTDESAPIESTLVELELPDPKVPVGYQALATDEYMKTLFPARTTRITAMGVGDALLLGIPGELAAEIGLVLKAHAQELGVTHPIIVGLANDYVGYILTADQYDKGGYESDKGSFYGPGFGQVMEEHARKAIDALAQSAGAGPRPS
jgi:neutral ceramidase